MNKRLFVICAIVVLALAGQASAQSVQFFGFGITCHKGYYGGAAPGAAFPGAAAAFPAPAYAFPSYAAPMYAFPAPAYTVATPPPAATTPAAAQPGNSELVSAINNLTTAINALTAKLPSQTTVPTVPAPGKGSNPSKFPVLSANTPSVSSVTPQRKEIASLVTEAERLRSERSKTDTGLASR